MRSDKIFGLVLILALFLSPMSWAAVLAEYKFDDGVATSSDTELNSTAGNFTLSGGDNTQANISSSTDMAFFRTSALTTAEASALLANDYVSFTFTPTGGNAFNLSSLTFDFGGSNATGSTIEFTTFAFLRTDAGGDDFSTPIGSTASKLILANGNANQLSEFTIDLSSLPEFQNISTATEFRFYLYSSLNNNSGQIARIDEITLNGSLVPEPSHAMLLGLGGVFCIGRRSRRH